MKYRGFLFDLDGTLVDSLPAVNRAWSSWGARHGLAAQQVLDYIHGKPAINSLRHFMAGQSEAAIQAEFRWLEQLEAEDTAGVQAIAGAHALLTTLNALDIPWAIVTSGSIPVAHARHKAAGLPLPEVFITAEDIKFGKPNPEPYLLGAERLGLSAPECVVVEDAPAGIIAGLEAGSAVVAVNPPADAPRLSEVALQVENLQPLHISKQLDGYFSVTLRA
ncbi:sugar phosphatase [Pantoea dispersa]|uniref:sugar phosphatase n=1 Tax=Pantoea TaxID=53335 RepID=UPI0007362131|nr:MULTISPECIES: sugar phosphatase [Pantoea]NIE53570.1 sugar phosphatase [Pantoea sp. Ap-870]KTS36613.1 phosphatase [Pantoea dispersa]KTS62392.1 phosphatase [Pantoea dispersa]MBS0897983.1 sugar phosphatase [Pantoea dispersa]MCT6588877.1 sugar phosphatase [Pantoea dispersa]